MDLCVWVLQPWGLMHVKINKECLTIMKIVLFIVRTSCNLYFFNYWSKKGRSVAISHGTIQKIFASNDKFYKIYHAHKKYLYGGWCVIILNHNKTQPTILTTSLVSFFIICFSLWEVVRQLHKQQQR